MGERVSRIDTITVRVKTLDDLNISNIGFVKIDVEGFEMQVLEGGARTIRENMPNMMVEIERRHLGESGVYRIFDYLKALGYFGYFVYKKRLMKIDQFDCSLMQNAKNEKNNDLYVNNFIFSKMHQLALQT